MSGVKCLNNHTTLSLCFCKVTKLQSDIAPLHNSLSVLSEKNGSLQADKRLLEDELKRWKAKVQVSRRIKNSLLLVFFQQWSSFKLFYCFCAMMPKEWIDSTEPEWPKECVAVLLWKHLNDLGFFFSSINCYLWFLQRVNLNRSFPLLMKYGSTDGV